MDTISEYKKQFNEDLDGIKFLKTYYDPSEPVTYGINTWHMRTMVHILQKHNISGKSILEIGCGPLIMNSLIVSPHFQNLYPGDYNHNIIKPLEDWFSNNLHHFDFSYMEEYISKLHQMSQADLSEMTRNKFQRTVKVDVHSCDVLQSQDKSRGNIENLSAIITRFCIDSCSPDEETYMKAVSNVSKLLKKDGIFLQMGFFEDKEKECQKGFWELGNDRYTDVRLTKDEIFKSLSDAGLKIEDWIEKSTESHEEEDFHNTSIYALYAVKI